MKFGELKAGDWFKLNGRLYEKISGNFADDIQEDGTVIETVEVSSDCAVRIFEQEEP